MQAKEIVKAALINVFTNLDATQDTIAQYFSNDYMQYVNGKTLDYEAFVDHVRVQQSAVKSVVFEFIHLIEEGNSVCSVHIVTAKKNDGSSMKGKVVAYFEVGDGKIMLCDEMTHLIEGSETDKDLGSRTTA